MDTHHVVGFDLPPNCPGIGRHENALAEPRCDRYTHDTYAVKKFVRGQVTGVSRGEHRDRVATLGKRSCEPLHIDRQPAHMGPIVREYEQYLHPNSPRFACTHATSRSIPCWTLTSGTQPK